MTSARRKKYTPYLLLLPAVFMTGFVVGYPIISNISSSFLDWRLAAPVRTFIGFDHYRFILSNNFEQLLLNTLIWTVGCVVFAFILGLALAVYVDTRKKIQSVYRAFLLLPWIIPGIIVAFIWRWMLQTDLGIVNYLLERIGIIDEPIRWFSNPRFAMGTVIFVNTWKAYPFWFIMLLAGLKSLPGEQIESARLDGASEWRLFIHIKLPHLSSVIMTTAILTTIWAINYVELIYAMTGGGPGNATMTLPVQTYLWGFELYNFGRSSAMAIVTLIIVSIMIIPYVRRVLRNLKEGGAN